MYGATPLTRSGSTLLEFIAQQVKAEQKKSSLHTFAFVSISEITWNITDGDSTTLRILFLFVMLALVQTGRPAGDQEGISGRMGCLCLVSFVYKLCFISDFPLAVCHVQAHGQAS